MNFFIRIAQDLLNVDFKVILFVDYIQLKKWYTGIVANKVRKYGEVSGADTSFYRYPSDDTQNNDSAIGI